MNLKSIQLRIALWTGVCLIGSGVTVVAYSVYAARQSSIENAKEQSLLQARSHASTVKAQIDIGLSIARTRAAELKAIKADQNPVFISREQANGMMRQVLVENPQFLGVWTLWEPNAFDGQDAKYAGSKQYGKTGRFLPYWIRMSKGGIAEEPLILYDESDWYQVPKSTKAEYVTDIILYPILGKPTMMVSVVAPIVANETFYGVTGQDISMAFLQELVDDVKSISGESQVLLVGSNGKLVAMTRRPDIIGKPLSEVVGAESLHKYSQAKMTKTEVSHFTDGNLETIVPIQFGSSNQSWAAVVIVPSKSVTAFANQLMWRLIGISLIFILIGSALLWIAAMRIVGPIRHLTDVIAKVADGDLSQTVEPSSRRDEIGILERSINHMTAQLRKLYGTLETQVSELIEAERAVRQAKEAAEIANQMKSEFLDIAAHELGTPVTAFSLLVQSTERQARNGVPIDPLVFTRMNNQVGRLARLVEDLLNVTRLERGMLVLKVERVDLNSIVADSVAEFRDLAPRRKLEQVLERSTVSVKIDPLRIKQVLGNFLDNVLKYTGEDCPIVVKVECLAGRARVSVTDYGTGLTQEQQRFLFTRFYRVQSDAVMRHPGLGLGLFISRKIVEMHGGTIGVLSAPEKGSTFYFELPVDEKPR